MAKRDSVGVVPAAFVLFLVLGGIGMMLDTPEKQAERTRVEQRERQEKEARIAEYERERAERAKCDAIPACRTKQEQAELEAAKSDPCFAQYGTTCAKLKAFKYAIDQSK